MSEIKNHRDLIAWQKGFNLAVVIYELTDSFPPREKFDLTSQMRRCSVSIASNIAKGYGRGKPQDYLRFLRMARGSLYELDTQLLIASSVEYVSDDDHNILQIQLDEVSRVLAGLIRSIERKV